MKTSKPGCHTEPAVLEAFNANTKLCPAADLKEYLDKTKELRKGGQLFIGYVKPRVPVGRQTFSRWIKSVLASAGIDLNAAVILVVTV